MLLPARRTETQYSGRRATLGAWPASTVKRGEQSGNLTPDLRATLGAWPASTPKRGEQSGKLTLPSLPRPFDKNSGQAIISYS